MVAMWETIRILEWESHTIDKNMGIFKENHTRAWCESVVRTTTKAYGKA